MATRRGARLLLPASLGLALGLALPSLARAPASARPCQSSACEARLVVGPEGVSFRSAERFVPALEAVRVRLFTATEELRTARREDPGGCRRQLRAPGIVATVAVCGRLAPVEVRARRTWGGSVALLVVYRARRGILEGAVDAASDASGGVTLPVGGGIGARRGAQLE